LRVQKLTYLKINEPLVGYTAIDDGGFVRLCRLNNHRGIFMTALERNLLLATEVSSRTLVAFPTPERPVVGI